MACTSNPAAAPSHTVSLANGVLDRALTDILHQTVAPLIHELANVVAELARLRLVIEKGASASQSRTLAGFPATVADQGASRATRIDQHKQQHQQQSRPDQWGFLRNVGANQPAAASASSDHKNAGEPCINEHSELAGSHGALVVEVDTHRGDRALRRWECLHAGEWQERVCGASVANAVSGARLTAQEEPLGHVRANASATYAPNDIIPRNLKQSYARGIDQGKRPLTLAPAEWTGDGGGSCSQPFTSGILRDYDVSVSLGTSEIMSSFSPMRGP